MMDSIHTSSCSTKKSADQLARTTLTTSSCQAMGILKSEKVEPIFRIVAGHSSSPSHAVDKNLIATTQVTTIEKEPRVKDELFAEQSGPVWHNISNTMITRPILAENLSLQFKNLPIFGAPECAAKLDDYENSRIREFVGFDLDDAEFDELRCYCSPENLKTGKEIKMATNYPVAGLMSRNLSREVDSDEEETTEPPQLPPLCTLERLRKRQDADTHNFIAKHLKYRGAKQFPLKNQEDNIPGKQLEPPDLEPGKDLLFRVRVFRPFTFQHSGEKHVRGRHSVFEGDIVVVGRQPLTALRDRFSCRNDIDLRLDKSHYPDDLPSASAKDVFPSGFLFINNVFYVDRRAGRRDTSEPVRRWALQRGLGAFPCRTMEHHRLQDVRLRLAHPEVYVHQGSCEHVFLFSEIRLLNRSDPLHLSAYPCHTAVSQNQSIYCTTCAEFGAKWLVTGSNRVPFDPAFFCDTCFKEYLYIDGQKIGDFKAYPYRGNELNVGNPVVGNPNTNN